MVACRTTSKILKVIEQRWPEKWRDGEEDRMEKDKTLSDLKLTLPSYGEEIDLEIEEGEEEQVDLEEVEEREEEEDVGCSIFAVVTIIA
jgi:hypothetical protein